MYREGSWVDSFPTNYQWSNATFMAKGMGPWGAVYHQTRSDAPPPGGA